MGFGNLKVHRKWHTSSKEATSNPSQAIPLTGDGVFNYINPWGASSFKLAKRMCSKDLQKHCQETSQCSSQARQRMKKASLGKRWTSVKWECPNLISVLWFFPRLFSLWLVGCIPAVWDYGRRLVEGNSRTGSTSFPDNGWLTGGPIFHEGTLEMSLTGTQINMIKTVLWLKITIHDASISRKARGPAGPLKVWLLEWEQQQYLEPIRSIMCWALPGLSRERLSGLSLEILANLLCCALRFDNQTLT